MLKLYYFALVGFLFTLYHPATALNSTEVIDQPINATVYTGNILKLRCTKKRPLNLASTCDAINALYSHYDRGQWGQECYNGWCVDARNINAWESPKECMDELRDKLSECLQQSASDGYVEQENEASAICMMHYWCESC